MEFGRHAILRGWWVTPVRVQIPASAPQLYKSRESEIYDIWLESATYAARARKQATTYPMHRTRQKGFGFRICKRCVLFLLMVFRESKHARSVLNQGKYRNTRSETSLIPSRTTSMKLLVFVFFYLGETGLPFGLPGTSFHHAGRELPLFSKQFLLNTPAFLKEQIN